MSSRHSPTHGFVADPDAGRSRFERELDVAWSQLTAPGGEFELTTASVRGAPLRVYASAPATLRDLWLQTATFGDRTYLVYGPERISYSQAHGVTRAVAAWLSDQGVGPGDRVGIAMRNFPEWLLIYWAALCVGATVVGMNAWWLAEEMAFALSDADPKVLFCDAERLERLPTPPSTSSLKVVAVRAPAPDWATSWDRVVQTDAGLPEPAIDPDDDACIFYTSGTTGFPKGARMTHRGCATNLMNIAFGTAVHALAEARAFGRTEPDAADPLVALITTPLFHVTANNCAAHPFTAAGGTLVLMHRWDPTQALDLIQRERVTNLSGVPTMAREILNHPALGAYDLSSLKTITGGGAQLPPDLVERIDRQASARASTGYGMTEASGTITGVVGEAFRLRPESCGRVLPSFDARVIDDEGSELPPGQVGELCVRGPGVISGYLNRPTDTADAITDGWLRTGDVARIDEQGYIFLVDRKKDMVLRGGENVYCAEVEAALFRHPDVAEACVFGVPDERLGEEVGAAVHLQPGRSSSPDDLRRHVRGLLAGYKAPRYIWISQTPLPRNATGKFMRRELRGHLNILDAG